MQSLQNNLGHRLPVAVPHDSASICEIQRIMETHCGKDISVGDFFLLQGFLDRLTFEKATAT